MKRSQGLKRYAKLRTNKGLRRTWIKKRPPRRIVAEAAFKPYVAWLHADGKRCVVCGTTKNIVGAHVNKSGGMSKKHGIACDMVRMCGPGGNDCHGAFDNRRGWFNGWSNEQRMTASRVWRVLHWDAFSDWVGIECARPGADPVGIAALLACEQAIINARRPELVRKAEAA